MPRPLSELRPQILHAMERNDWDTVFALCDDLESSDGDAEQALILRQRGYHAILHGEYERALEILRRAEEHARRCDPAIELAPILNNQGMTFVWKGEPDHGERLINEAHALYIASGDRKGEARALYNLGLACEQRTDWAKGLATFNQALAIYEELGEPLAVMRTLACIAIMLGNLGRNRECLEWYTKAYEISVEQKVPRESARFLSGMSRMHNAMGDHEMAMRLMYQALDGVGADPEPRMQSSLLQNMAMSYAQMGDDVTAIDYLQRSIEVARGVNYDRGVGYSLTNLAEICMRCGMIEEAATYNQQAIEWSRSKDIQDALVLSLSTGAKQKIQVGDLATAQVMIDEALLVPAQGVKPYIILTQAELWYHKGNIDEAERWLANVEIADYSAERRLTVFKLRRDIALKRQDLTSYVQWNEQYVELHERTHGGDVRSKMSSLAAARQIEQERRDHQRHLELLHAMLPQNIAERIIAGETVNGDRINHAAVLFADIVGFTEQAAGLESEDVVRLLATIFRRFDEACQRFGVTKLKTMGDSYICFCDQGAMGSPVVSTATLALHMLSQDFTWPSGAPVQFRLGINAGPIAAGVIGTERLQYDIWGDTVNVAARLESSGEAGRIHVSQPVADELAPLGWTVESRGEVDLKGKGRVTTYWLVGNT